MQVLVWDALEHMVLREVPSPHPAPGWLVLDVRAAGICGSEISSFLGKNELRKPPLVMGHEFSGTVTETGEAVSPDWIGKRVVVNPLVTCQRCRYCQSGERQLCSERKIVGVDYPGGFAERAAVPATACSPVTDLTRAALIEPLACGVRAVERSRVLLGDTALVFGAGMIGLSIVKLLRARGALKCVVVDVVPSRLEWAKQWGATETVDASREDVGNAAREVAPEGFDCVLEAVGHGQTRSQSIAAVRRGGRVVFVGLHENITGLPGNSIVRNETEVLGSFAYTDDEFRRASALAEGGFIDARGGWLDLRPLKAGQEAFAEQATGRAPFSKIVLEP